MAKLNRPTLRRPSAKKTETAPAPVSEQAAAVSSGPSPLRAEVLESAEGFNSRASFEKFSAHETHGKLATEMNAKVGALETALKTDTGYQTLNAKQTEALSTLDGLATSEKGVWKAKEGTTAKQLEEAEKGLRDAKANVATYLKGDKVGDLQATKELKEAHTAAQKSVADVGSVMNGWTGKMRVHGMGNAAKHSWSQVKDGINVFGEAKGPRGVAFARVGSVAAGGGMLVDAFARGKTRDGEDRGFVGRLTEGLAGVGLAGAGVFAGKAL